MDLVVYELMSAHTAHERSQDLKSVYGALALWHLELS